VDTAGKYEHFGERCTLKNARHPTTVVTVETTRLYVLNKWDLLKRVCQKTIDDLTAASQGNVDDDALRAHCHTSDKWRSYKTSLVAGIVEEHRSRKCCSPTFVWTGWKREGYLKLPCVAG
ncbi:unnamed protein product, partial [Ostreobium quekettii]